jgi:hypothetical protein
MSYRKNNVAIFLSNVNVVGLLTEVLVPGDQRLSFVVGGAVGPNHPIDLKLTVAAVWDALKSLEPPESPAGTTFVSVSLVGIARHDGLDYEVEGGLNFEHTSCRLPYGVLEKMRIDAELEVRVEIRVEQTGDHDRVVERRGEYILVNGWLEEMRAAILAEKSDEPLARMFRRATCLSSGIESMTESSHFVDNERLPHDWHHRPPTRLLRELPTGPYSPALQAGYKKLVQRLPHEEFYRWDSNRYVWFSYDLTPELLRCYHHVHRLQTRVVRLVEREIGATRCGAGLAARAAPDVVTPDQWAELEELVADLAGVLKDYAAQEPAEDVRFQAALEAQKHVENIRRTRDAAQYLPDPVAKRICLELDTLFQSPTELGPTVAMQLNQRLVWL